jgi:hypothetical protein
MGRWQPYIYGPEDRDLDDFNPRAITMASRQPPPTPKHKPDGPLLDFNKHPDSYLVMPYGNTAIEPMNPRTKLYVKIARGLQLFLRLCTLLGAVGLLLCTIFIRGSQDTEGWLMRIPVRSPCRHPKNVLTRTAWRRHGRLPVRRLPPHPQSQLATCS